MQQDATIIDFLGASLSQLEARGQIALTPAQEEVASALAIILDNTLEEMVLELEAIASCQQAEEKGISNDKHGDMPAFVAFCAGLNRIGQTLLPHLIAQFHSFCKEKDIPPLPLMWVIKARSDAFIAYLVQLAQVHGVVFLEDGQTIGAFERGALASLQATLRDTEETALQGL